LSGDRTDQRLVKFRMRFAATDPVPTLRLTARAEPMVASASRRERGTSPKRLIASVIA
jgi:hypothetical protein